MKRFILRVFLFASPLVLLFLLLTSFDVFKVFGEYDHYYEDGFVATNREMVCTRTYNKYREREKFNAFIFGNSRSHAFKCREWSKYLGEEARPFHFDGSGEGVYGVANKVRYLDQLGDTIRHALVIVDRGFLTITANRPGHLSISPPCLSNESKFRYYLAFLEAQTNPEFVMAYLDYSLFRTYKSYMGNFIKKSKYAHRPDDINCDIWYGYDDHIARDSLGYYQPLLQKGVFFKRTGKPVRECKVTEAEAAQLRSIREVFDRHQTSYEIVVSPIYDQIPMEKEQLALLKEIFGEAHVHDFSGRNKFTEPIGNYYEASHYKPHVANEIMRVIYAK